MTDVIHLKDAPPGWLTDGQHVYIGRAGKGLDGPFGNPFTIGPKQDRGSTLQAYEVYLVRRLGHDQAFKASVRGLKGKTLVCFCKPHPCHGDILAGHAEDLA